MSAGDPCSPLAERRWSRAVGPLLVLMVTAALFVANRHGTAGAPSPFQYQGWLNWDGRSWLEAVDNFPQGLLTSIWVDRPVYPALVAAVRPLFQGNVFRAYQSVNYGLYLGCTLLFLAANRRMGYSRAVSLGAVILFAAAAVPLTWLGQPLPQFVDYCGVAFLYYVLACRYQAPERWTWTRHTAVSLAVGLLLLAKPYFSVYPFFIFLAIQQRRLRELPSFLVISVLPYLVWYLVVTRHYGCRFYSHSMDSQFQQGTWIITALKAHDYPLLAKNVLVAAQAMAISAGALWTLPLLLVGLVALWHWPRRSQETLVHGSPRVFAIALVSLWTMAYGTSGYMPPRLMVYIFPMLYPLLASVLWHGLGEYWPRARSPLYASVLAGYAVLSTLTLPQYVILCC